MTSQKNEVIRKTLIVIGVCLLVAATVLLLAWQWHIRISEKNASAYVNMIRDLIPEPQGAVPEERRDNTMSTLSIDGTDFVGILEMPRCGSALPVCADWGKPSKYPCHFSGSVYERTMQIGGTTQKGQYDFYREISVGDSVFFTDMEGNRYTYTVTNIHYAKNADQAALGREDADLKLFIKNVYAFEYVIVFCDVLS